MRGSSRRMRDREVAALLSDECLLTVDQASVYLGVSSSTLNHWRCSVRGPRFVKLDRSSRAAVRYRLADLRGYVASRTFDSVAEAELADAMSRVGVELADWGLLHPFVIAGPGLLVDSAWADAATLRDVLTNPCTRIRWLQPRAALALPWTRHGRRTVLVQQYLNSREGRGRRDVVEDEYWRSMARIGMRCWGSHPDMTIDALEHLSRVHLPMR